MRTDLSGICFPLKHCECVQNFRWIFPSSIPMILAEVVWLTNHLSVKMKFDHTLYFPIWEISWNFSLSPSLPHIHTLNSPLIHLLARPPLNSPSELPPPPPTVSPSLSLPPPPIAHGRGCSRHHWIFRASGIWARFSDCNSPEEFNIFSPEGTIYVKIKKKKKRERNDTQNNICTCCL